MFPQADIIRWRAFAPWADDDDVEQDLVITLALFDIFRDETLRSALAFRGGTALHKLHLAPAARYSEDIDLVQREQGPIGPTLSRLRRVLGWIGPARSDTGEHPKLTFRFETETGTRRRVKLEINSHEHVHSAAGLTPLDRCAAIPRSDILPSRDDILPWGPRHLPGR